MKLTIGEPDTHSSCEDIQSQREHGFPTEIPYRLKSRAGERLHPIEFPQFGATIQSLLPTISCSPGVALPIRLQLHRWLFTLRQSVPRTLEIQLHWRSAPSTISRSS